MSEEEIRRMVIYQAAQLRQQVSDFADHIYPDDEYIELQNAVTAMDQWIEKQELKLKEVGAAAPGGRG
jgi:hypothetical protein